MKEYSSIRIIFLAVAILTINAACQKFVDVAPPETMVTDANVFSTDQTATSSMVGLYSDIMSVTQLFNGYLSVYPSLYADDINPTIASGVNQDFFAYNLNSNTNIVGLSWLYGYKAIYQANAVLEGVSKSSTISASVKSQLTGEAKLMRAFSYYYLINLFGDVPLITSVSYQENASVPRTPIATVRDQILKDLTDAVSLLQDTYVSTGRTRPNKWAAASVLARFYLYIGDYPNAEKTATSVISSGVYQLESNLNNVFLGTSKEAIWQIYPTSTAVMTGEGTSFVPPSAAARPNFVLSTSLLNAFATGDLRKTNWVSSRTIGTTTYQFPFKYKIFRGTPPTEYNTIIRYAELFLIRSEARAQQNNVSGSQADLNTIRARAGLLPTTAIDKNSLLAALEQENRLEYFAEWAHRFIDLKRLGRIDAVLSVNKTGWKSTFAVWPIPFAELQANPFLSQNPGY